MTGERVLITGGAGFVGSHVAGELLDHGYRVRVLDNLSSHVHGTTTDPPPCLDEHVEFVFGDLRDPDTVRGALQGVDAVVHAAALIGIGQSMYEMRQFVSENTLGTALLFEALIQHPVRRLIVASSMSVYGEGTYRAADGRLITRARRLPQRLRNGTWDIYEEFAQEPLRPVATPESKPLDPLSIYGLSKCDQERMCLMLGKAYGIPTTALRLFNVFGYRQTLSNPYSGILAVCASRFLDDKAPLLFEDGQQIRDFVHVRDVARSFRLALENPLAADRSFNIASGTGRTIQSVARMMSGLVNRGYLEPIISNRYRSGDIRHCFADMTAARTLLGFESRVPLEEGLEEVVEWVERTTNKSPVWVVAGETAAGRQQYSGERLRHWSW